MGAGIQRERGREEKMREQWRGREKEITVGKG